MSNLASDLLFGVAVADALGVPVEFKSPTEINITSVQSNYQDIPNRFAPFGSWNKPVGTFSDDSSLTFCTAEYLAAGETDLNDLMDRFKDWLKMAIGPQTVIPLTLEEQHYWPLKTLEMTIIGEQLV